MGKICAYRMASKIVVIFLVTILFFPFIPLSFSNYHGSLGSSLFRPSVCSHITHINSLNSTLSVGIDENYPPHEWAYYDKTKGKVIVKGFNVDVMNEIVRRLNITIEYYPMQWTSAVESLKNGTIDVLFMAVDESRKQFFDFSESILSIELAIFVTKLVSGINSIPDLNNHTVGVEKGDISETIVKQQAPNARIIEVDNQEQGLELLNKHEIYAFVGNYHTCWYIINQFNLKEIKQVGVNIPIGNRSIAVKKGNLNLLSALNSTITEMKLDGTLQEIIANWFSSVAKKELSPIFLEAFAGVLGGISFITIISLISNYLLQKAVSRRTKKIERIKNKIQLINDLFANEMNNTFNVLLNLVEIFEFKHAGDFSPLIRENKHYFLEAIYKISMTRELMLQLEEKKKENSTVSLMELLLRDISTFPFLFKHPQLTILGLNRDFIIPFNTSIDILFKFLVLKVFTSNEHTILIEQYDEKYVRACFFFNTESFLISSLRDTKIYSTVSLLLLYIIETMKTIDGYFYIDENTLSLYFPIY